MKQDRSLQDLAAELERQTASRKDYLAPQGKLSVQVVQRDDNQPADILLDGFNGQPFGILPHAHNQFADVLGIPRKYYDRMKVEQPRLLADNLNTWLHADAGEKRMVRTLDGKVRAVLSSKYRPLDNFELAKAVLPKLFELKAQVVSASLTETRMYIKAILPELSDTLPAGTTWGNGHNRIAEYDGRDGGKIVAALVVKNSEVGDGALAVEPSVFTTWCSNLAILKAQAMRKYHVGRGHEGAENFEVFRDETREADDRAFFLKVTDITNAAFDRKQFEVAVAQIRAATEDKIEGKLQSVVDEAVKVLALPPSTGDSILTYLAQGGDFSRWGLSSAITATANNLDSYEGATFLERAGGELLAMPKAQFQQIAAAA